MTVRAIAPPRSEQAARRYRAALRIVFGSLAVCGVVLIAFKLHRQPLFIDYLTMWTGGGIGRADPARLYDFPYVDRAQAWLLGAGAHDRPFPYPPSALLLFAPMSRLPFWVSGTLWTAGGGAVFAFAAAALAEPRHRVLTIVGVAVLPSIVWTALSGQCAFLVGALAIAGFCWLGRRPVAAGIAIGLALALKPTVLLLAPLSLMVAGRWRALIVTGAAGIVAVGLSTVFFGIQPWIAWITVAPRYLATISADPRYITGIVAPAVLAGRLGLHGVGAVAWRCAWIAAGAAIVVVAGRKRDLTPAGRLTAVVIGSLFASPYAMTYETTLLAPGAAITLVVAGDARSRALALFAYIVLALAGLPNVGVFALLAYAAMAVPWLLARSRT